MPFFRTIKETGIEEEVSKGKMLLRLSDDVIDPAGTYDQMQLDPTQVHETAFAVYFWRDA